MAGKKDIHVVPHKSGGWARRKEGASRAGSVHATQRDTIKVAREQARKEGVELVVHGLNGRIRDSDSYGNDPMPPRDRKH